MSVEHVDVVIVGAGLSGVGAACHLMRQCPAKTIAILEARNAVGGTWDLFRYPGIRSDSDMFTLGYSFRPWTGAKSIADGLNGTYAGENCVRICTALGVESLLLSEDALRAGFRFMYSRMKLACEVAGSATAAALLAGVVDLEPGAKVAAVVSGGNVDPKTVATLLGSDHES